MKKLLFSALLLVLVTAGCAVTDYPVIVDARGDFSGIIRTGHKAYIEPTSQVATIWSNGSDELFTMVYQNQYGDQKLYTFNNFDPTGAVNFLDQTYCDWRYDGCEIVRAWNPVNSVVDTVFDYDFFPDCSGARSLSLLVSETSRVGECGDAMFWASKQQFFAEFANLATISWRGGVAYLLPIDSSNTTITLNNVTVPLFGSFTAFVNKDFQTVFPMTPNTRQELRWLSSFVDQNGSTATASITYGSLNATVDVAFSQDGLQYNLTRY